MIAPRDHRLVRVNPDRLWDMLMVSAAIGRGPKGGLRRLALSAEDKKMRDQLGTWAGESGYELSVDRIGNMFVTRPGTDAEARPVLVGSHLDTQWAGGRFDGILGVLSGLETLRTLDEAKIATRRSIVVVNWTNEEGARFQPPMMGSFTWAGGRTVDWMYAVTDKHGVSVAEALAAIGYRGERPVGFPIDSYIELHIEQGPRLDAAGKPVGVVTGGFPSRWMTVRVQGENAHNGPTPMEMRRNALVGAARVAVGIDEIGWKYAPEGGKSTAARLDLSPNLPGIISDEAILTIDFRHPDPDRLELIAEEVATMIATCAERSNTEMAIVDHWRFGGLTFDGRLVDLVRQTARALGVDYLEMASEVGHDAYNVATVAPACMIFTPCVDGITHNLGEDIRFEQTVPGVEVLANAVLARANQPL